MARDSSQLKADIYFAERGANGEYQHAQRVPGPINVAETNDSDPFIAPDESYPIFHSDRPGGYGEHDLYISFRSEDGTWSDPVNLGPQVNSAQWEMGPRVTHDGARLLFTRCAAFKTQEPSRIYSIDARLIDGLRSRT